MKLGVLGGTFDPPHIGHLILARFALEQLALDRVLFIPAGDPWRKAGRDIAPADHRLEMTRLAVQDEAAFEVDDIEVRREGPSYTVDTLHELAQRLGETVELVFILGEDALADLPFWHDPAGIAAAATLAVAPREGVALPEPFPVALQDVAQVTMPCIGISSTLLRERIRAGLTLRDLAPESVETYIEKHGLYQPV